MYNIFAYIWVYIKCNRFGRRFYYGQSLWCKLRCIISCPTHLVLNKKLSVYYVIMRVTFLNFVCLFRLRKLVGRGSQRLLWVTTIVVLDIGAQKKIRNVIIYNIIIIRKWTLYTIFTKIRSNKQKIKIPQKVIWLNLNNQKENTDHSQNSMFLSGQSMVQNMVF